MAVREWIELTATPHKLISNVVKINNDEFIVALFSHGSAPFDIHGIHKYNMKTNKWSLLIKYPFSLHFIWGTICLNPKSNELLMVGDTNNVYMVNLKTNKIDCYPQPIPFKRPDSSSMVFMTETFHVFGGAKSNLHYEWSNLSHTLQTKHKFPWKMGNVLHGLVDLKSKQKLLLFGGYDYAITQTIKDLDDIWCYDKKIKKWSLMDVKLPIKINSFGYILTPDERFVIIFGGEVMDKLIDDIWIWDLDKMEFKKSKLKCPMNTGYRVEIMSFNKTDAIVVHGWIRFNYAQLLTKSALSFPIELVRMIALYYIYIDIYLLQHYDGNKMWKINIDEIIHGFTKQLLRSSMLPF